MPPLKRNRPELEMLLALLVPVSGLLLWGLLYFSVLLPPCPLASMTGIPCPTCGMTRAGEFLLAGNFGAAFLANPLSIFLPLFLAIAWVYSICVLAGWIRPLRLRGLQAGKRIFLRAGIIAGVAALWIYIIATVPV